MSFDFKITDNTKMFIKEKNERVHTALDVVGIQAESFVKTNYTKNGRIDTGLLRNSVTHAVSGGNPAISSYKGETGVKSGRPGSTGVYDGTVPDDPADKQAVYVGTNVEYAIYVEEGTRKSAGTHDIKNGVADHLTTFKQIMEKVLETGKKS